jgi:hypothetical protein
MRPCPRAVSCRGKWGSASPGRRCLVAFVACHAGQAHPPVPSPSGGPRRWRSIAPGGPLVRRICVCAAQCNPSRAGVQQTPVDCAGYVLRGTFGDPARSGKMTTSLQPGPARGLVQLSQPGGASTSGPCQEPFRCIVSFRCISLQAFHFIARGMGWPAIVQRCNETTHLPAPTAVHPGPSA